MEIKAVLFDLDGTLLPMDQAGFTKGYFKELAKVLSPLGVAPDLLIQAVWAGVDAMVRNNGEKTNLERFWETFARVTGMAADRFRPAADRFYSNEFHRAKVFTGENPFAVRAVRLAGQKGRKVILATNPLFPMDGQAARLSWIGLGVRDFELVTSYEEERFCKPNPLYYRSICERMKIAPEHCLMIGNDEEEDMYSASSIGMQCYLVTDCRIESREHPWSGERGSFAELLEKLQTG